MTATIAGQDYDLRFTFRVFKAITSYLGFPKLQAGQNMMAEIGFDNVPNLISITITENLRKQGVKGKTPSHDQIADALDDHPEYLGEFITALGDGYGALFPEADAAAKKLEAGE